jgi:hypothetical protein
MMDSVVFCSQLEQRESGQMKVDSELEQTLTRAPNAQVSVIVHVEGNPVEYTSAIEAHDLSVVRAFRLTNTLAVRGLAFRVLQLADEPWVSKIESDRRITTLH